MPVLLFDGPEHHPLATWARDAGVTVVLHEPSLKKTLSAAAATGAAWQTDYVFDSMLMDLGLLAGRLAAIAASAGACLDSVLFMAADTLLLQDINACSLPTPRILSAAGDPSTRLWESFGAYHINMSAWAELHPDLMRFCAARDWAVLGAHGRWMHELLGARVSALPETYTWQPWWGRPRAGTWGKPPEIQVLHLHGPVLQESLCVLKYLDSHEPLTAKLLEDIRSWCDFRHPDSAMQQLVNAQFADSGALFKSAYVLHSQYLAKVSALESPTIV